MLHNMFAEWLLLRDLTLIPHIMWFEYVQARSEAKYVHAYMYSPVQYTLSIRKDFTICPFFVECLFTLLWG